MNVGVIRTADVNKPWARDVIAAYQSPAFKAYAVKRFPGYKLPQVWGK